MDVLSAVCGNLENSQLSISQMHEQKQLLSAVGVPSLSAVGAGVPELESAPVHRWAVVQKCTIYLPTFLTS